MEYSLKIIKEISRIEGYEIMLVCSLFKLNTVKGSYREFSKYCRDFLNWIYTIPKNFCVRMYIDESILNDEDFINIWNRNIKHLEIVLFEFKDFKLTKKDTSNPIFKNVEFNEGSHDGTFGSIARFLALYKIPDIPENIKWVWITDIDLPTYIFNYESILDLKRSKSKISFYSKACNDREWFPKSVRYPISAGKTIVSSDIKFDIRILETFLNDVLNGKYKHINESIMKSREILKQHYAPAKYFTYGFDELFLNEYLYNFITSFKYIVYYEISIVPFKNEKTLPYIQKHKKLESLIWKNKNMNISKNKLKLLEYNDSIYEIIEKYGNKDKKSYRLNLCLKDYKLYRENIELNTRNNWGLTSKIIIG